TDTTRGGPPPGGAATARKVSASKLPPTCWLIDWFGPKVEGPSSGAAAALGAVTSRRITLGVGREADEARGTAPLSRAGRRGAGASSAPGGAIPCTAFSLGSVLLALYSTNEKAVQGMAPPGAELAPAPRR